MLKNRINIFWLIIYVCLHATQCIASDKKETLTLYFDLGERGGWVPFRNAEKNGGTSVLLIYQKRCKHIQAFNLKL